jgi:hypothetical protein
MFYWLSGENMPLDVGQLLKMSQAELDDLFKASPVGPIPNGPAEGTAIIAPGKAFSPEIAECVSLFVWKGKTFDAERGVLSNKLSIGMDAIVAEVYKDKSWLDGEECIVLDYSKTPVAKWIRDEMREVHPGFYLGKVYWAHQRLIDFCLQFPAKPEPQGTTGS